jgi:hypothetical protein
VKPGERVVASGNMLVDSQAQINNLGAGTEASPALPDPALTMNAEEHQSLERYLTAIATTTNALADDDLATYNTSLAKLPPPPKGLSVTAPEPAKDLASARRSFLPVSQEPVRLPS